MDIESLDILAREQLEARRSVKAAELLEQQRNHIIVYGKYEKNKLLLERKLAISDRIEGLIIGFGVSEIFERGEYNIRRLEYDSNRIPIQTGNDNSVELFAVAWKMAPRKGNVSILRRTVKPNSPLPSGDTTLEAGVTLYAQDTKTGDEVNIKTLSISGICETRKLLSTDDMGTIAGSVNNEWLMNETFNELEQVLDLIDQSRQLSAPVVY